MRNLPLARTRKKPSRQKQSNDTARCSEHVAPGCAFFGYNKPVITAGLTGGIASGKSTVARMFADLGAQTASADEDARAVLAPGSAILVAVLTAFPEAANADGTVNRVALGARIFADTDARNRLNALMHPAIRVRMRGVLEAARASDLPGLLVYEVPLLFEGELQTWFDATVATLATRNDQATRLQEREQSAGRVFLTEDALAERLAAQMPPEEKARRADFVIRTDTTLEETRQQVEAVYRALTTVGVQ